MRGRGAGKELTTEVAEDTERECFEVSLKISPCALWFKLARFEMYPRRSGA